MPTRASKFPAGSLAAFAAGVVIFLGNRTGWLKIGSERQWFTIAPRGRAFDFEVARGMTEAVCAGLLAYAWFGFGASTTSLSGFYWGRPGDYVVRSVAVPYRFVAASTLAWPLARRRRLRRRTSRLRQHQCPACGYDLCATPVQCAECGAATARAA